MKKNDKSSYNLLKKRILKILKYNVKMCMRHLKKFGIKKNEKKRLKQKSVQYVCVFKILMLKVCYFCCLLTVFCGQF